MNPTGNADVVKKQMAGSSGTDSSGQAFKMDLQLFGEKNNSSHLSFDEALNKLEHSSLKPGQTIISKKRVMELVNDYNPIKASSSVYTDATGRYLVEGHHTTVAATILGKEASFNMNTFTNQPPSATNIHWTKKWFEFWKTAIKVVN